MRRFALTFVALLALVGCVPVLSPVLDRQGDAITVTVTANQPAYSVTLSVLDAATDDERCGPIGPDFGCVLGDIGEGQNVVVNGIATGEASCVAFGFSNPSLNIGSYRPYPCSVGGSS